LVPEIPPQTARNEKTAATRVKPWPFFSSSIIKEIAHRGESYCCA
jgi:hypothetical protein